jgi:gliding motility-associated-like protein
MSFVNRFKNTFLFLVTVATLFCNEGFSQTKKVTLAEKTTISNPVTGDLVSECPDDGTKMPKIFLCGALASKQISTSFTNIASVNWEKLNESSCAAVTNTNCPNTNTLCSWSQVGTGSSFTVSDAGQYRIRVIFSDSSKNTFYFNVYQNGLDIPITKTDIYCEKAGEITIAQLTGYEYSLDGVAYQSSNVFAVTDADDYKVRVRRKEASATDCVFEIPVTIAKNDLAVTPTITQPIVSGDKGTIKLTAANVREQYFYKITQGATLINQVGPVTESEHTFPNLNSGTYTWSVKTADCDWKSGEVTINSIAPFQITTIIKPITCQPGSVQVSVTGGTAPYKYYFNGNTTAESSNSINAPVAGTYSIKVVDSNNQSETISVAVPSQPAPVYTIEKVNENCYYPNAWQIKFNVTNTNRNTIRYSIDNGTSFSTTPIFKGLTATPAGTTFKTIIEYTFGGVKCTKAEDVIIVQPQFGLSATAGVSELIGCMASPDEDKAKIRITNPQGGTPPYQYSFDNQATWATTTSCLKTPGQYVFYIKDASGCISALPSVTVENIGVPTVTIINNSFNCDGTSNSTIEVKTATSTSFSYTYSLDGGPFQTTSSFNNISSGNHTFTVNYQPLIVPTFSNLLNEDFGYGADTTSPGMSPAYCFERQVGPVTCHANLGWGIQINDGEYAVTSYIVSPFGAWYRPIDHTNLSIAKGRYLVVNIQGDNTRPIIYEKTINDIIPNQPISVEFYAANLLRIGSTQYNPNLRVALVNASGVEVDFYNTGSIPKTEKWQKYSTQLNPGNNTTLRFQVRSIEQNQNGNDVAIDDISAYQIPKLCAATRLINFTVPTGKAFDASIVSSKNCSCAGLSNGEITIEAQNFNATTGYQYSKDNGATWQTAMTSPFTITSLAAANYSVKVRYNAAATGVCVKTFPTIAITVPQPLTTQATITTTATCTRGATITASLVGGTPFYKYELWDELNTTKIRPVQNTGIFDNVIPGKYTVRGIDANGCSSAVSIIVVAAAPPVASLNSGSDKCYDSVNQATLKVDVVSGTSPFAYSLNGAPSQNSNIFTNIIPGTYTIKVTDSNSCEGTTQRIIIGSELKATATLVKALDCSSTPDATIKVTIDGGASPIRYQILKGNTIISSADINLPAGDTSFTYTVSEANPATYSFNIIDANGCTKTTNNVVVSAKTSPKINSITQLQSILCHGSSTAAIKVNLDTSKGIAPFTYSVKNTTTNTSFGNQLSGLTAGSYEVTVTDSNFCTDKMNPIITEPDEIKFEYDHKDITCISDSGVSKGSVIIDKVIGGIPVYNYFVTGVNGYNNSELNNTGTKSYKFDVVDFGLYQINVVDSNGCSVLIQDVKVASPPEDLNIDVSTQTVNCSTGGTAIVSVSKANAFSSNGPFYFAIYKPGLTYSAGDPAWQLADANKSTTFTGLIPGVKYTFIVYDETTKCYHYKTSVAAIPTNSTLEIASLTYKNISCKGSADGKVSFTIKNNYSIVTPVSYQVYNSQSVTPVAGVSGTTSIPANGTGTITNLEKLPFGNYFILVKEETGALNVGCSIASGTFNITESAIDLNLSATVLKNVNCRENGVISVQAKDGTAPYQYQISAVSTPTSNPIDTGLIPPPPPSPDGVWQTLNIFTVNQGGTYTVFVKDAYGCEKFQIVTVTKDSEPVINVSLLDQCVNEGQFEIQIKQTTAGIAPYYLSVNGSVFNPSGLPAYILNQNSGSYTIAIKDSNGCTNTQTKTIYSPLGLSSKVIQFPTCKTFDGSIEAIASGGSGNYDYAITGSAMANGATFSGLDYGSHDLKITDKTTTCQKTITINLESPTPVTGLLLTQKEVSCHGGNDGSITATIATPSNVINNNPIYKYSLNGGTPQASNIFSGLVKGTYTIDVISGRGCVATDSIEVIEPAAIVLPTPSVVEFGCNSTNTLNNASITISGVTGGSGTYTQYEFIKNGIQVQFGPNPIYIEADLDGGSYTINVYDDKGCLGSTTTSIQPFYILNKIIVDPIRPISCNAPEEIQLSTSAIGGTVSTMEYSLSPISGSLTGTTIPSNTTGSFTGLTVGEYLITARNTVTNCSLQLVHTVEEPNTFEISIDSVVDVSCYGSSTGSASITLIDKTTPSRVATFSYHVLDSLGNLVLSDTAPTAGPITIPNLKAGVYSVTASLINAPFCSVTKKFTITQPTSALVLSESHSDITCVVGNNDGKITALPTGGWSDFYEFKWEKQGILLEDWGDVSELTNMTHGDYILYSRDAKGCVVYQSLTLAVPSPIVLTVSSDTTILSCFADRKATITTFNVTGGQGSDYRYTLNQITPNTLTLGPQISNYFKNLGAGTYTVSVNDNWSCSAKSGTIEIQEPANVIPTLSLKTTPTCTVAAQLDLQIFGGTPPYSFSADNTVFNSFSAALLNGNTGVNHYFVKDNNDCGSYLSNDVVVESPKGLSVTIDTTFAKVNCHGESTASILATAQGGLGSYSYMLLDELDHPLRSAQTSGFFSGLPAGKYKVKVTSADCVPAESTTITITEPTAKLKPSYSLTNALCAGSNDGTVKINSSGGTVVIKQSISPNLSQFTESNLFENLAAGTYDVLVQDALGCYEKTTQVITQPSPIIATTIASSIVQEICFDDKNAQFTILLSGGTLPYSVALDNPSGPFLLGSATQTQFDFIGLTGGSHTVYVQDSHNCTLDWIVNLDESVKLNPSTIVNYDCVNNSQHNLVTVNLDSSISDFSLVQFALDGGVYQPTNVFSNLTPGDHFIRVKHNNGCVKDSPVFNIKKVDPLILSLKEGGLNEIIALPNGGFGNYTFTFNGEPNDANPSYIYYKTQDYLVTVQDANGCNASVTQRFDYIDICTPNYFTPNGDGLNDTWAPGCTINYKNLTFSVLDRYGRELGNYHLGESWDGKYNGQELPSGDYWYVLKLNNSKDDREFVGHFTLYR